jgi:hypothetical protein
MKVLMAMRISIFRKKREVNNDWLNMKTEKEEKCSISLSFFLSVGGSLRVFLTL